MKTFIENVWEGQKKVKIIGSKHDGASIELCDDSNDKQSNDSNYPTVIECENLKIGWMSFNMSINCNTLKITKNL